jgi:hypothetical protein
MFQGLQGTTKCRRSDRPSAAQIRNSYLWIFIGSCLSRLISQARRFEKACFRPMFGSFKGAQHRWQEIGWAGDTKLSTHIYKSVLWKKVWQVGIRVSSRYYFGNASICVSIRHIQSKSRFTYLGNSLFCLENYSVLKSHVNGTGKAELAGNISM